MALAVSRAQVLAHRAAASGLHRDAGDPLALRPLALGIQDTPPGSARLALAARGALGVLAAPDAAAEPVLTVWAARGAPHLHRRVDLPAVAAALWPLSDADATARINTAQIKDGARLGLAAFVAATTALHEVVTTVMPKGEVSTAVSARVPESLTHDCEPCAARHISGAVFQQVGVAAGVHLLRAGRGTALAPVEGWTEPVPPEPRGAADLVRTYLSLSGPATPSEAAAFLGTSVTEVRRAWPDRLAEVAVDGRRTWLPEESVDELMHAPPAPAVRLLPPGDPFLQARDRALLVPDRARQRALWTVIASPGALLVAGEVAGTWRAKVARRRLDVSVTPFDSLDPAVAPRLEAEARLVADARGLTDVQVLLET